MNSQIASAKADFEQTSGRLLKNLTLTPDDKLNWSPSPTARTPLELAYHAGEVIGGIHSAISGGEQMPSMTTEQIDAHCREEEKKHGSREDLVKMIEDNSAAYVAWLEALDEEKLSDIWHSPFGDIPLSVAITLPTYHTASHVAQLEYIQTIYGDRIWH